MLIDKNKKTAFRFNLHFLNAHTKKYFAKFLEKKYFGTISKIVIFSNVWYFLLLNVAQYRYRQILPFSIILAFEKRIQSYFYTNYKSPLYPIRDLDEKWKILKRLKKSSKFPFQRSISWRSNWFEWCRVHGSCWTRPGGTNSYFLASSCRCPGSWAWQGSIKYEPRSNIWEVRIL